jgi:hypothetical protein
MLYKLEILYLEYSFIYFDRLFISQRRALVLISKLHE